MSLVVSSLYDKVMGTKYDALPEDVARLFLSKARPVDYLDGWAMEQHSFSDDICIGQAAYSFLKRHVENFEIQRVKKDIKEVLDT
jgi:hypothetical protein